MIFWLLLRLNGIFLVKPEDGNLVDYFLILNVISAGGGYLYFF